MRKQSKQQSQAESSDFLLIKISQYNKMLYRNTYLEIYKNAHNNDSSITVTFAHFTQIYNTLGCVLQDIEFQIGKLLIQQPPIIQTHKQGYQMHPKYNDKSVQKQGIRVEQCNNGNTAKNGKAKMAFEKQMPQIKSKNIDTTKKISNISQQTESNWIVNKMIEGKSKKPRETVAKNAEYVVEQARRPVSNQLQSTSFENLFQHKPNTNMDLQQQSNNVHQPNPPSRVANPAAVGDNLNTFDDFFDRFFQGKNENSRRSC